MMFDAIPDSFCKPQQVSCVYGCPISLIYRMKFDFFFFIGLGDDSTTVHIVICDREDVDPIG